MADSQAESLRARFDFEAMVLGKTREVLDSNRDKLSALGLTPRIHVEIRSPDSDAPYESEMVVDFWDERGFQDTVEFFVYRNGMMAIEVDQIAEWVTQLLDQVLSDRERWLAARKNE